MAVGLGSLESDQLYALAGLIDAEELDHLRGSAVGDICGRFFDRDGSEVIALFADRTIGIELSDLRRSLVSIGIAGGADKVDLLIGALRGEHINVLITDELTAHRLMEAVGHETGEVA